MEEAEERWASKPSKVVPAYQMEWEYPIWQLRFEEATGLVAVECRDAETLQVSFSAFNAKNGELVLQNYKPANAWWTGLAGIRAGLLYLQGVAAKGVGRPAGITAVAITDGQVKWQLPEYSIYGFAANELLVLPASAESMELIPLIPETGEVIRSGLDITGGQTELVKSRESLQIPQQYAEGSSYFNDLKEFILRETGCVAHSAIDYLETDRHIVLGFYPEKQEQNQVYRLFLFTISGVCLLQEDLGKDLSGIGTDNFFIFQDTLILFKNKSSLLGYEV
jgi:hypothetical protein